MLISDAAVFTLNFVVPFGIAFTNRQVFKIGDNGHIEIGHDKTVVHHGHLEGLVVGLVGHNRIEHITGFKRDFTSDLIAHHN